MFCVCLWNPTWLYFASTHCCFDHTLVLSKEMLWNIGRCYIWPGFPIMGQTLRNALLLVLTQGIEALCEELSLEILKQLLVSSIFGTCLPNYQYFFVTFLKFQCHGNEFVTSRVINKQQVSQRKVVFSVKAGWQMRYLHSSSVQECVVRKVMNCT